MQRITRERPQIDRAASPFVALLWRQRWPEPLLVGLGLLAGLVLYRRHFG